MSNYTIQIDNYTIQIRTYTIQMGKYKQISTYTIQIGNYTMQMRKDQILQLLTYHMPGRGSTFGFWTTMPCHYIAKISLNMA